MPTYQYRCTNCGKEFEELQKISEPPIDKCPFCGGKPERLISGGAGLIFKGSGFYLTDYKNKSKPESSGSSSETKSETKKESKPSESKPSSSSGNS
jgi:putative FmdB family regulatory protein